MKILVLNSGSSSLKYQLIDMENEEVLAKGNFERIGQMNSFLTHTEHGIKHKFERAVKNHRKAIQFALDRLSCSEYGVIKSLDEITAIGHRVVHGGEKFSSSIIINNEVLQQIKECIELAPLHNPSAIAGIEACQLLMPDKINVAVFDTAFHQTISEEKYLYPIPYQYYEKYKIRKYGFHGISHQYVAQRTAELLKNPNLKIVNCHLGQGASLCAIQNGKSVDTSMGFTPVAGIPMGSRSGDLDPSIVTFLMKKEGFDTEKIERILNKKSGLLGLSELSLDCRDIEVEYEAGSHKSKIALENFCYIIAQYIAKYAVSMNGLDVITFTAGIGEKGPIEREKICEYLEFLGVNLDKEKNSTKNKELEISKEGSKVKVYVIPTNEELMIARDTAKLNFSL